MLAELKITDELKIDLVNDQYKITYSTANIGFE